MIYTPSIISSFTEHKVRRVLWGLNENESFESPQTCVTSSFNRGNPDNNSLSIYYNDSEANDDIYYEEKSPKFIVSAMSIKLSGNTCDMVFCKENTLLLSNQYGEIQTYHFVEAGLDSQLTLVNSVNLGSVGTVAQQSAMFAVDELSSSNDRSYCCFDKLSGQLTFLSTDSLNPSRIIEAPHYVPLADAFYVDSNVICTASRIGEVSLIDLRENLFRSVKGHIDMNITCLAQDPTNKDIMLAGFNDGKISSYDIRVFKTLTESKLHSSSVTSIKFNDKCSQNIFSSSADGTVLHWAGSKDDEISDLIGSRNKCAHKSILPDLCGFGVNSMDVYTCNDGLSKLVAVTDSMQIFIVDDIIC